MLDPQPARVRFAPSPTGRFHIGGARTALYDFLLARQTGGQFILRIEDTDRKRFVPSAEDEIIESLHWLGLDWDEGPDIGGPYSPYRQSERTDIYRQHAEELVAHGHGYYCFCTPERLSQVRQRQQKLKQPPRYDGLCRKLDIEEARGRIADGESYVIRFKTPREGSTAAVDLLRGPITVENSSLDDYILLKSDGLPVYHLAAMVDDYLMEITHVFRGSEWLPTFPLHVLIYEALNWKQPIWVHLSIFLNPSGKGKMSKRDAGVREIYVLDLKQMGYLPEGLLNWIALMGWSYDDHTEFFTLEDLIEKFSLQKLHPSPAAVDYKKLDHFNGNHIRSLTTSELVDQLRPHFEREGLIVNEEILQEITPLVQERIRTLEEAVEIAGFFFREAPEPEPSELVGKKMTIDESIEAIRRSSEVVESFTTLDVESLEEALRALAEDLGLKAGQLFGILRIAVTGQRISTPLIESMVVIGKEEVLNRIAHALEKLESYTGAT
ncbi:MAG: glutamate--tRNA ligase [Anaerolineaceae bacterium]|nr:MAG: glutamate--tRNA ligase [Anaerolineaceae bacterium]